MKFPLEVSIKVGHECLKKKNGIPERKSEKDFNGFVEETEIESFARIHREMSEGRPKEYAEGISQRICKIIVQSFQSNLRTVSKIQCQRNS